MATGVPASVPVRVAHELLQAGHRYLDVRYRTCTCRILVFLKFVSPLVVSIVYRRQTI